MSVPPPGYNPSDSLLQGGSASITPLMGGGGYIEGTPDVSLLQGGNATITPLMGGGVQHGNPQVSLLQGGDANIIPLKGGSSSIDDIMTELESVKLKAMASAPVYKTIATVVPNIPKNDPDDNPDNMDILEKIEHAKDMAVSSGPIYKESPTESLDIIAMAKKEASASSPTYATFAEVVPQIPTPMIGGGAAKQFNVNPIELQSSSDTLPDISEDEILALVEEYYKNIMGKWDRFDIQKATQVESTLLNRDRCVRPTKTTSNDVNGVQGYDRLAKTLSKSISRIIIFNSINGNIEKFNRCLEYLSTNRIKSNPNNVVIFAPPFLSLQTPETNTLIYAHFLRLKLTLRRTGGAKIYLLTQNTTTNIDIGCLMFPKGVLPDDIKEVIHMLEPTYITYGHPIQMEPAEKKEVGEVVAPVEAVVAPNPPTVAATPLLIKDEAPATVAPNPPTVAAAPNPPTVAAQGGGDEAAPATAAPTPTPTNPPTAPTASAATPTTLTIAATAPPTVTKAPESALTIYKAPESALTIFKAPQKQGLQSVELQEPEDGIFRGLFISGATSDEVEAPASTLQNFASTGAYLEKMQSQNGYCAFPPATKVRDPLLDKAPPYFFMRLHGRSLPDDGIDISLEDDPLSSDPTLFTGDPRIKDTNTELVVLDNNTYSIRRNGVEDWMRERFSMGEADLLINLNLNKNILREIYGDKWNIKLADFLENLVKSKCFNDVRMISDGKCNVSAEFIEKVYQYFQEHDKRTELMLQQELPGLGMSPPKTDKVRELEETLEQLQYLTDMNSKFYGINFEERLENLLKDPFKDGMLEYTSATSTGRVDQDTEAQGGNKIKWSCQITAIKMNITAENTKMGHPYFKAKLSVLLDGVRDEAPAKKELEKKFQKIITEYPGWRFLWEIR